jgi:hypothetical protein
MPATRVASTPKNVPASPVGTRICCVTGGEPHRPAPGGALGAQRAPFGHQRGPAGPQGTLGPLCRDPPGGARAAAAELDRRGIATPSDAKWSAMGGVKRVRERLARSSAG